MTLLAPLFATLLALQEMPQAPPLPVLPDPRIAHLGYESERVYTLDAALGFATVIELGSDEQVENIVVGNSANWQVTANRRGDHLIIKPLPGATPTDCIVTTDARRYVFVLQVGYASTSLPFVFRFDYPANAVPDQGAGTMTVATYLLSGARALLPAVMTDDGQRTTIVWPSSTPLPAIYAQDALGKEALVNGRVVGNAYIVEAIAPRFIFRLGKAHASADRRPVGRSD